jgi:GT2 family glycosyltransferase
MIISVVIPTYKRLQSLLTAIKSLQDQILENFEIIIVDNAADREIFNKVEAFTETARIRVKYIPEPRVGLHNARHAGARASKGDILVFTDDDATFDPKWLGAYQKAFSEHPEMVAAGGPVRPMWEMPPPKWLLDFMGDAKKFGILSLMEPYKEFRLDAKGIFYGVNMAIRRRVLFEAGGFNPEVFGEIWLGDGETGLNRKLWDRGMLIGYVPEAVVYHHIPPQRMTVEYFCRRLANEGACDMYSLFHPGMPSISNLTKSIVVMIKGLGCMVPAWLVKGRTSRFFLKVQMYGARVKSQIKYLARLVVDKDFRSLVRKTDWLN